MRLKTKLLEWSAGFPVAMLNRKTAEKIGAYPQGRISIETISKPSKKTFTILDVAERVVRKKEILVSSEIQKRLSLKNGQLVDVNLAATPKSLIFIKKKLSKKELNEDEINEIIKDVVENSLSEAEIALFVSAMYKSGMSFKETIALTKAILKSGNRFNLKNKFVVDKHSIGGVAGNRTTPIIVSICAAAGLTIPKTSSRAITSAAGTADVIETIARVDFSVDELKKILKKTNACIVWAGSLDIVPADSKIIQIEKMLKIDPEAQSLASIISKKLAVGSEYILIDIPYGRGSKVATKSKAIALKKKFEKIGKYFHKKMKVLLTDGSEPIGNGIGPALELIDVIKILNPREQGPEDLEKKSLFLAAQLLEMAGKAKKGQGFLMAENILKSGKAFEKFKQIIKAQKGSLKKIKLAKFKKSIFAKISGKVSEINNDKISFLARLAGCPNDKFAGVYFYFHVGEKVEKGEKLLTIYANSKSRLLQAIKFYREAKPIKLR